MHENKLPIGGVASPQLAVDAKEGQQHFEDRLQRQLLSAHAPGEREPGAAAEWSLPSRLQLQPEQAQGK